MLLPGAAMAGAPFLTDDPVPTDHGHWGIYGFTAGTQVKGGTTAILPGVEVDYGAAPNLDLHVVAPLGASKASGGATQYGYGDTELGLAASERVAIDAKGYRRGTVARAAMRSSAHPAINWLAWVGAC